MPRKTRPDHNQPPDDDGARAELNARKATDAALRNAIARCRDLLREHDQDAVIVLSKPFLTPLDDGTTEEDDAFLCIHIGRKSKGHASLCSDVENGMWFRWDRIPQTLPRHDDEEEVEE